MRLAPPRASCWPVAKKIQKAKAKERKRTRDRAGNECDALEFEVVGRGGGAPRHTNKRMKYFIETYGCQMNVHDSERMAGLLEQAGYEPTPEAAEADVVVI